MKQVKRFLAMLLSVSVLLGVLSACGSKKAPMATLTLEDGDEILIYLYPDKAPNTVANFISLANSGFYDGRPSIGWWRTLLCRAATPTATVPEARGYTIDGEFKDNGFKKNDIAMEAGVIAMARFSDNGSDTEEAYNSAGSQFIYSYGR